MKVKADVRGKVKNGVAPLNRQPNLVDLPLKAISQLLVNQGEVRTRMKDNGYKYIHNCLSQGDVNTAKQIESYFRS